MDLELGAWPGVEMAALAGADLEPSTSFAGGLFSGFQDPEVQSCKLQSHKTPGDIRYITSLVAKN